MTRIRFIEWLFAVVFVVAIHALALTGWAWFQPAGTGGVRLPPKVDSASSPSGAAVPLIVSVVGETDEPAARSQPTAEATPRSSNEIIVVPTEPSVPAASGQSTVEIAETQISPPPPNETPAEETREEPPSSVALQLPTFDEQQASGGGDAAPRSSTVAALRDPVPVPKSRPDELLLQTEAPPVPPSAEPTVPQTPGAAASLELENAGVTTIAPPAATEQPQSAFNAAQSTYYRLLLADIRKQQRYPDEARHDKKEGTVYLQIVVERTGRIKSYDIVKSSGFQELDDAAVQTLVRANPVSPFPEDITESELRFGLPMRFGS